MKLTSLAALVLIVAGSTYGQHPRKTVHTKPVSTPVVVQERPSAITFAIYIAEDNSIRMEALTGLEGEKIRIDQIKAVMADFAGVPKDHPIVTQPHVRITPDKNADMDTVIAAAKASRISATTKVSIITPSALLLNIPPDPELIKDIVEKPNPLTLVVRLEEGGRLYLNNDPQGTIADPNGLITRLKDIFKQRADNGVFREGTNEIETSVGILPPHRSKFTVVAALADILDRSGAGPLYLDIDEETVLERKEIIPIK